MALSLVVQFRHLSPMKLDQVSTRIEPKQKVAYWSGPTYRDRNVGVVPLVQIDSDPGSIAKSHLAVLDGEHAAKLCIPEVVGIDVDL